MKTDKKGFLLAEETLKIILAVIAVGFLALFLFSLYNSGKDSRDLGYAKDSLNLLMQEIDDQKDQEGVPEVQIYNPKGWVISSWPNIYTKGMLFWETNKQGSPQPCINFGWDNCICICKKNTPDKCSSKGVCLEDELGLSLGTGIKIKDPPITLSIDYSSKIITKIK